ELCDLQWSQIELATGRLHARRAKNGSPSVHRMQGDEIRALRRPGFNGSAGSSFAGSTTPRTSWALFNSPASLSSSGDFEIGSSQASRRRYVLSKDPAARILRTVEQCGTLGNAAR